MSDDNVPMQVQKPPDSSGPEGVRSSRLKLRYSAAGLLLAFYAVLTIAELFNSGPTNTWEHYKSALSDMFEVLQSQLISGALFTALIGVATWVYDQMKARKIEMAGLKKIIMSALDTVTPAATFALIGFFIFLYIITPQKRLDMESSARKAAETKAEDVSKGRTALEINVNQSDPMAREGVEASKLELARLRRELKDAQAKLAANSPMNESLGSVNATITIETPGSSKEQGDFMDAGKVATTFYLAKKGYLFNATSPPETYLVLTTRDRVSKFIEPNTLRHRYVCDRVDDRSTCIGKPIRDLRDATFIQLDLNQNVNSKTILGGQVELRLNDRVSLKFTIPPQTRETISVMVRDLKDGLAPLMESE